jgi:glycerol kinase
MLPKFMPSGAVYGAVNARLITNYPLPIAGIAGDQQAALFGQACYSPGMGKNTYGTGYFFLVNTGNKPVTSQTDLISTVVWGLDNRVTYALEGSIFVTGAEVQWLRDGLGIIKSSSEIEPLARTVPDNGGLYFVPALTELGAPCWDMYARGAIDAISGEAG